jgi:hypothetical protein
VRKLAMATTLFSVGACGRFDFGGHGQPSDAGDDALAHVDAAPALLLSCTTPSRVTFGHGFDALIASPTPAGFQVFAVDGSGNLSGSVLEVQPSGGVATTVDRIGLGTNQAGTFGAISIGSQTLLASIYGRPTPAGTMLQPLSTQLARMGSGSMRNGVFGGDAPVATSNQTYVFATIDRTGRVDAHPVDATGADAGASVMIVDPAETGTNVRIATADDGFVVTYATSSGTTRIERLDPQFNRTIGPLTVPTAVPNGVMRPVATWAPTANIYLVTWYNKDPTDGDDIWYEVLDARLQSMTSALKIGPRVFAPIVVPDDAGTGFWIVYESYATSPDQVLAAHIDAAGTLKPRAVLGSSGGGVNKFTAIERAGQPVLVWTETGGTGPDLYLDAMCGA